jgi:LPS sulfotransferase NodH
LIRLLPDGHDDPSNPFAHASVVTYEDVVADPGHTVQGLLDSLGVELPSAWRPRSAHRRQADDLNAEWVDVLAQQQARPPT